jgi:hypothetical protein
LHLIFAVKLRPTPRVVPAHHFWEVVGRGVDYPPAPLGEKCRQIYGT